MMKSGTSSLNANAAPYIPLCERGATIEKNDHLLSAEGSKSRNATNSTQHHIVHRNPTSEVYSTNSHGSYASSSKGLKEVSQKDFLDEDVDMDLAYLQMMFPAFSDECLSHIYFGNRGEGDLENAVDILNQLELCTGDSPELPDTLEIGDTLESQSSKEGASLKLKEVEVETPCSSLESAPTIKVTAD